jgi:AcrR family transcriptional regulator
MTDSQRGSPSSVHEGFVPDEPQAIQDTLLRKPLQDRSRRTLERLVAAAARLLEEHGPDAVTVTGVTREARTSVGAFYARFSGKEEMVRYLGERWLAEALELWQAVTADVETGGGGELRHGMTTLAGLYLNGPARRLALLHGQDDPVPSRLRRFEDRVAEVLAAGGLAGEGGGESDFSDPTRFLRAVALVAGVRELGVRATEGRGPSAGLGPGTLAEVMVGLSQLSRRIPGEAPSEGADRGSGMPPRGDGEFGEPVREEAVRGEDPEPKEEPEPKEDPEPKEETEPAGEPDVFDVWG